MEHMLDGGQGRTSFIICSSRIRTKREEKTHTHRENLVLKMESYGWKIRCTGTNVNRKSR